tara:strand:+ start:2768 stop:2908 length:141 start_codon:yes stop_codon:yes gene_type:complete
MIVIAIVNDTALNASYKLAVLPVSSLLIHFMLKTSLGGGISFKNSF